MTYGSAATQPMDWASVLSNWTGGQGAGVAAPALGNLPVDIPMLGGMSQGMGGGAGPGFMDKMLGYRGADGTQFGGWGGLAVGAGSGIMNSFLGMQQLGVAKDQLEQGKKHFELNFGAQKKLTNNRLEDRQRARVAANPTAYESVGTYMGKHGI